MAKIAECPSYADLSAANDVRNKVKLHFYQLLYFQQPQLTAPGSPASPFEVSFDPKAAACIRIDFNGSYHFPKNPDYSFRVLPGGLDKIAETDKDVLDKCRLILKASTEKKEKTHSRACCPLAEVKYCVCDISFACPLHGTACHGTHD